MKHSDKENNKIRLQVYLSHNGVCSRRKAMDVIFNGAVSVNGRVVKEPSFKVDPAKDRVEFRGREIEEKVFSYLLLNKPKGFVTTKEDKYASKTVYDLIPRSFRHLSPVGRLDKDTEGLLILTNDGDLAYRLTHPKFNVEKKYFVEVAGDLTIDRKEKAERGVYIDGARTARAKISNIRKRKSSTEFLLVIHEGKKRQIRRMFKKIGNNVLYLKRIAVGPMTLGSLKPGKFREIRKKEIEKLG